MIDELREHDFPIELEWFAPHSEFRFPTYGEVNYDGIEIELRQALEPWHVLGEEGAPGGTVRYVDSSLERLQVKVKGMPGTRYQVTCNGITVPLKPTGTHGELAAGVRFRAWAPRKLPTAHHPAAHAAGVRSLRQLGRALHRRLPLSRRASWRPRA